LLISKPLTFLAHSAGATGTSDNSTDQLVQAMAGLGGGSDGGDGLNAGLGSAETSQQPFLTTPQHSG
jgi:hypothetical protein